MKQIASWLVILFMLWLAISAWSLVGCTGQHDNDPYPYDSPGEQCDRLFAMLRLAEQEQDVDARDRAMAAIIDAEC